MTPTPEQESDAAFLRLVEERMRPGNFSAAGFLGPRESLRDVLDADARALAVLGVGAAALANFLEELLVAAIGSKRATAIVGDFRIGLKRYKGPQICPFAPQPHENPCPGPGDRRLASVDWSIRDVRRGLQMSGPGLIVHLIGAHGFFEGRESPYRVAPHDLARLLGFASSAP